MSDDEVKINCPWCGLDVAMQSPSLVPDYPQGFRFEAPCCKRDFLVTRFRGRFHVQRYMSDPATPPRTLPS